MTKIDSGDLLNSVDMKLNLTTIRQAKITTHKRAVYHQQQQYKKIHSECRH